MPLLPIPTEDSWVEEIREAVVGEFWATISILDPDTEVKGTWNPATDAITGGQPATAIISGRAARIQPVRSALEQSGSYEWGAKRNYRIEFLHETGDPVLHKGLVVKVTDVDNRAAASGALLAFTFEVTALQVSSHSPFVVLDARTEQGVGNG